MTEGFFTKKELQPTSRIDGKIRSCVSCQLGKWCINPKMPPYGNFKKRIMVIGEAPGETEDRRNKPWQGKAGMLLQETMSSLGIDLFEDCISLNACNCRPIDEKGNNRTPSNYEIECCRKEVIQAINQYYPSMILLLGGCSIYSVIGYRWQRELEGITKWRGWTIPDQDFKTWICPTFHPSYILRGGNPVEPLIWKSDLQEAIKKAEIPLPRFKEPEIEEIKDLQTLEQQIKSDLITFDYETTGKKPQGKKHKILIASIADTFDHAYAFVMPSSHSQQMPFLKILANSHIGKMSHNMKFEDNWTEVKLRWKVKGWQWDSMLAAHILDNRPGITGLKFQTYINFGVVDYDSDIRPYLENHSKDGNALNTLEDFIKTDRGRDITLHYCALDSIYQYRLAMKQMELMNYSFLPF